MSTASIFVLIIVVLGVAARPLSLAVNRVFHDERPAHAFQWVWGAVLGYVLAVIALALLLCLWLIAEELS